MKRYQKMAAVFFLALLIYPHLVGFFGQGPGAVTQEEKGQNATGAGGFVEKIGVGEKTSVTVTRSTLLGGREIEPGMERVYLGGLYVLPIYVLGMNFTLIHSLVLYSSLLFFLFAVFMCIWTKEVKLKWS